jgi:PAS domain S-box-containing protein
LYSQEKKILANAPSKNGNSSGNKLSIPTLTEDFDRLSLLQKLQFVVDTIPQSIFWKNLNSEWVWANARFVSDAGADTLEDILGKNDLSYADRPWTRDQGEAFIRDDRMVLESGQAKLNIIEPQRRSDGRYAWLHTNKVPLFDDKGKVIGLIGTYEDISERTQEEIVVRRYQHMLETIFNSVPVAIFWKDKQSQFLGCNAYFAERAGMLPKEIAGKSEYDMPWTTEQAEKFIVDDQAVMESEQPRLNYIEHMRQADGRLIWVQTNKVPLYDADGNVTGILGTFYDITEQIETSEALRQARKAAEAERQRLARNLHDAVSQTLWTASLIADVLPTVWDKDRVKGEQNLRELRQLTQGALAEMRMLLLELRPAALKETKLHELLQHLAEAFVSRKEIEISVSAEPVDPPIDVKLAYYRVMQEALNNISRHARATKVTIELTSTETELILKIADNGKGFDVDLAAPGRMGLSIMRERAAMIQAKLAIDSKLNLGTTITVRWSP